MRKLPSVRQQRRAAGLRFMCIHDTRKEKRQYSPRSQMEVKRVCLEAHEFMQI